MAGKFEGWWPGMCVARLKDMLAGLTDTLAINAVIYSELSMTFERIEVLEEVVSEASLSLEQIPREALFRARMAAANRHLSEDQARHRSARGAPLCRSMVMAGRMILTSRVFSQRNSRWTVRLSGARSLLRHYFVGETRVSQQILGRTTARRISPITALSCLRKRGTGSVMISSMAFWRC
jgi:hypothetical protein